MGDAASIAVLFTQMVMVPHNRSTDIAASDSGVGRYRLQWAVALWLHPLYRCPQFYQRQPSATGSQLRQSPPLMPMLLMVLQ